MFSSPTELCSIPLSRRPGSTLRTLASWYGDMERAEQRDGWLAWCRKRHVSVACSMEFMHALACALGNADAPVLEIGAGNGELAEHLQDAGVDMIPTDWSPGSPAVIALEARDALRRYNPRVVLTSFVPADGGIERDILQYPSVHEYVYIGPLATGHRGLRSAWNVPGWKAERLHEVEEVLISRLDYLSDCTRQTHCRRASALQFTRIH